MDDSTTEAGSGAGRARRAGPTATSPRRPEGPARRIELAPVTVWRTGLVLLAVVALGAFGRFVLQAGGGVLVTVLMAWFAALAMEPAVGRLSARMPRGRATLVVMGAIALFLTVFVMAFGNLFVEQVSQLVRQMPDLLEALVDAVNRRFGTSYAIDEILRSINLSPAQATQYANTVLGGVLSVLGSVAVAVFNAFAFVLLAYYFSADNPRLRLWIAGLLPARLQRVFVAVWDLTVVKTGGYVAARVVLATLNAALSAIVFLLLGLPSWLALGMWTGVVAQLIPTIGTYVSIALPVLVGLLSDRPLLALAVLAWGVAYQQVENLFVEPRISSRAVNVHPAVTFSSVLLGTALFGVAGALVAIPIVAAMLALLDIFVERHEVLPDVLPEVRGAPGGVRRDGDATPDGDAAQDGDAAPGGDGPPRSAGRTAAEG